MKKVKITYDDDIEIMVDEEKVINIIKGELLKTLKARLGDMLQDEDSAVAMADFMINEFDMVYQALNEEKSVEYENYHDLILEAFESEYNEAVEEDERLREEEEAELRDWYGTKNNIL